MSGSGGRGQGQSSTSRLSVTASFSTRTLQHPSFMPLYLATGSARIPPNDQSVQHITPAEVFFIDPTMNGRAHIELTDMVVLDCLQLNTPPPIMSPSMAPPTRPNLLRSTPRPTRNLGSSTQSTVRPSQVITQEPRQSGRTLAADATDADSHLKSTSSTPSKEECKAVRGGVKYPRKAGSGNLMQQGKVWSALELEVANTLVSGFRMWDQPCQKSAELPPNLPPNQHNQDSPEITANQEPEAERSSNASLSDIDTSHIRSSCNSENGGQVHED